MLSALASELPTLSLTVELFSTLGTNGLSLGFTVGSLGLFRFALSEFSTGVFDSELESRVVGNFGFVVDMLGLVLLRDATELGAA